MDGLVSGTGSLTVSGQRRSPMGAIATAAAQRCSRHARDQHRRHHDWHQHAASAVPGSPANNLFINGGTLQANGTYSLNANRSILLGPSSGIGSGTLAVTGSNVVTVPGTISNNGTSTAALIKTGTGTLILTGTSNTYSGGIAVTSSGGTASEQHSQHRQRRGYARRRDAGSSRSGGFPGLTGQYWSNQNPGNSTFGFTNETDNYCRTTDGYRQQPNLARNRQRLSKVGTAASISQ